MKFQQLLEQSDINSNMSRIINSAKIFLHRQAKQMQTKDNDGVLAGDVHIRQDYDYMNTINVDVGLFIGKAHKNHEAIAQSVADNLIKFIDTTIQQLDIDPNQVKGGDGVYNIGNKKLRVTVQPGITHTTVMVYRS